jgi:hypothetical protein
MSYFRASTGNPLGWRSGVATLGNEIRHAGPDWKTVAAHHDAAEKAGKQMHRARQRHNDHRMALVDAAARGDRTRVRMARLSGLGLNAIDLSSNMVRGAQYVFHFQKTGVTLGVTDMTALAQTVAADSNFNNVSATDEPNGFQVRFIYNGISSTVGAAGGEMQKVINDRSANGIGVFASAFFTAAEGGPSQTPPTAKDVANAGGVFTVAPDGTIQFSDGSVYDPGTGLRVNPDGSIVTAATSAPGAGGTQPSGSSFDSNSMLSTIGIGGAVALGLGAVLLIKSL